MTDSIVLRAQSLSKSYFDQDHEVVVFKEISLAVEKGSKTAIIGVSGSGKSTLLHVLSGLDHPTSGDVYIHQHHFNQGSEAQRGHWRNQYLGFIYQFHHLLPEFNALDNVAIPCVIGGASVSEARSNAELILRRVGLSHRLSHKPASLSGGERQRVAIARALVTKPSAVLADEPTGNLDSDNAHAVFDLMCEINEEIGTALVMVTHDLELAKQMDYRWRIQEHTLHQE